MRSGDPQHGTFRGRLIMCPGCVSDALALLVATGGMIAAGTTSLRRLRRRLRVHLPEADTGTECAPAAPSRRTTTGRERGSKRTSRSCTRRSVRNAVEGLEAFVDAQLVTDDDTERDH